MIPIYIKTTLTSQKKQERSKHIKFEVIYLINYIRIKIHINQHLQQNKKNTYLKIQVDKPQNK